MLNGRKIYLLILVLIGWFALIAQLVVHLKSVEAPLAESLIRYFSYFTILTNLLVIFSFTVLLFSPVGKLSAIVDSASVQTAVTLYITVVGLIYNLVLRQLWHSEGLQVILHDLLHTVIPLASIIYWWIWTDARHVLWRNIAPWLVYPALYAFVVLARGYSSKWYPYPFLDISKLGILQVLLNSALLVLTFLFFAFLFVFIGKKKNR